jgi:hypothetical protein
VVVDAVIPDRAILNDVGFLKFQKIMSVTIVGDGGSEENADEM